jgi:PIN domain nuclease of toxin-antitoxin system
MVLLDTCALIWYTIDPKKLSKPASKACANIPLKGAYISSISLWEIGLKIKNKKLDIGTTIEDYVQRLKQLQTITIIPVDENIWLRNLVLDWVHRDPADRTIVATADLRRLPIVTSDTTIREYYPNIIW